MVSQIFGFYGKSSDNPQMVIRIDKNPRSFTKLSKEQGHFRPKKTNLVLFILINLEPKNSLSQPEVIC